VPFAIQLSYEELGYWSLVRRVTGPDTYPNPIPDLDLNPNLVVDLRNKETLNSFSYYVGLHAVRPFTNLD